MCYSGIHRAERNPRHLKDGISGSSGPRPPYSRWRLPRPLENPCPLAHSVARSPATGIGNIDIKEEGFDWMLGKGGEERRGGRHSRAFSMLLHPIHSPRRKTSQSLTDVLLVNANARKESPSGREQEQRGSTPSPTSKMTTTKEQRIGFLSPILYRYWKIDASLALSLSYTHLYREAEKRDP